MKVYNLAVTFGIALVLASCATQPAPLDHTPGFLSGLFNGFTMVFSLIGSIFYNVRIYAYPNSGGWYDFGFVLGAVAFFSTAPLLRTKSPAAPAELTPSARSSEVVRQTFNFIVALCLTLAGAFCWALPVAVCRSEGLDAADQLVGIHTGGNLAGNVSTIEALTRISPWLCTALRLCFFSMLRPAVYLTQKLTRPRKGRGADHVPTAVSHTNSLRIASLRGADVIVGKDNG